MGTAGQDRGQRDRIIDAALELAARSPWAEVSLSDIAAEAKVPLRTVYEEFGSRSTLAAFFAGSMRRFWAKKKTR